MRKADLFRLRRPEIKLLRRREDAGPLETAIATVIVTGVSILFRQRGGKKRQEERHAQRHDEQSTVQMRTGGALLELHTLRTRVVLHGRTAARNDVTMCVMDGLGEAAPSPEHKYA